jgi:hypothetical protein
MAKEKDILEDQKAMFDIIADSESDQREMMLDDLKFGRMGEQWPEEVKVQRRQEGRPMLTINVMPTFVRQVVNDARQNRPAIKVKPVGAAGNTRTANVFNGIIKNIENVSRADIAYDTAMDFAVSAGIGYYRIDIEYEHPYSFDQVLRINRVPNVFSVFGDPYSKRADSADWNNAFVVDYMSKDEFQREYKGAEEVDWESTGYSALQDPWLNDEKVLVCESWERSTTKITLVKLSNGEILESPAYKNVKPLYDAMGIQVVAERPSQGSKVTQRMMTGAEILETTEWAGKYIPIVPVYGEEINIEGRKLYRSLIHNSKDAQRMMNYWRTTSTELVSLAPRVPFIGEEGAFDVEGEAKKWASANSVSYAYLQYKRGYQPPMRQPLDGGGAIGAMGEAMAADRDIKNTMGMHEASLGQKSNETSGKAISLRQREGDVSTFHFIDNLNRAIAHGGSILVDLIPLVYTSERVVRIIQPDGKQQSIKVGSQQPQGATPQAPQGMSPPQGGVPVVGSAGAPPPPSPSMPGTPPGMVGPPGMAPPPSGGPTPPPPDEDGIIGIYDLGAGIYDVVVDTGKSFTTQREEFATQATEFLRAFPQAAPIIGDILVKSLDWPQAEEIAGRLKAMMPPQATGGIPPQLQEQIQKGMEEIKRLTQENEQLKVAAKSDAQANQIEAQKVQIEAALKEQELKIKSFQAETDRMKLVMPPPSKPNSSSNANRSS